MATVLPRGYRSATEYRFDEEQAEAIVQATAYHRTVEATVYPSSGFRP